jgi:acetoin utilization deacetylase AcuC-like enzyme
MRADDFMGSLVHLVNQPDAQGRTPLLSAAALEMVQGAESEAHVETISLSLVLLLLEHGADPAVTDSNLNSVLHWASARGRYLVATELLKYPDCSAIINSPNRLGDTPLLWASALCQCSCIKVLVDAGASIGLRNNTSLSPLDVAGRGLQREDISVAPLSDEYRIIARRTLYEGDPRYRTLVLSHKDCLGHMPRSQADWECPERISDVMNAVTDPERFDPDHQEIEFTNDFEKASAEFLGRAHCAEYIKFVSDLARQMKDMKGGAVPFTPQVRKFLKTENKSGKPNPCDTSFSVGSLDAARRAAGAVMTAVDRVLRGRNRNAFCIVRPPGHHAGRKGLLADASSHGFCIFNSVAAGALHALESPEHRLSRVAIIDIDVHHGNGTEEIVRTFKSPDRLLFFSIHLYDKENETPTSANNDYEFYPGSGSVDQTAYNIINVPLVPLWKSTSRTVTRGRTKRGEEDLSGRRAFRHGIVTRLLPALRAFNPELVLLSSGFDAAQSDVGNLGIGDAGGLDLTPEDFFWVTKEIQQIADMCCEGRVVSVLEGGYGCKVDMSKPGTFGVKPSPQSASSQSPNEAVIARSQLDRTHLANAACAHLRGLVDPYAVMTTTEDSP